MGIVDPLSNHVDEYLKIINDEGYQLTHVIDTHIHGDHVSGSRALAERTGAKLLMHESAEATFPFQGLKDGDIFQIGNPKIKAFHTPGHTPESITLNFDKRLLLTGDTIFVGDVGRIDLYKGATAEAIYDSVQRLMTLDDYLAVFPAHYGNSSCGKGLSPVTSTTLGFERRTNYALQAKSKEEFLRIVNENLPPPPDDYVRIKRINAGFEEQ
jgi:glyoxylase-like metal-dependent hydrolase (beta-lactamase superfamily II)